MPGQPKPPSGPGDRSAGAAGTVASAGVLRGRPGSPRLLEIGTIAKPHGLNGEVVVDLVSNRLERLAPGSELVVQGSDPPEVLVVQVSRAFQRRYLVGFEGVGSREAAEALRGAVLLAAALPTHDPDELFVHELIGSEVVDASGRSHGTVVAVQANPASDLLVGEAGWLVPLRFVTEHRAGRIVVDGPEGIFE